MSSPNFNPTSTSYTPGRRTEPDRQNSLRFACIGVPAAWAATIPGTFIKVSTLFTAVGFPNSPTSNGNGGLLRGSPRYPSMELKIAVSSPQM